jgi:hypothetical protein
MLRSLVVIAALCAAASSARAQPLLPAQSVAGGKLFRDASGARRHLLCLRVKEVSAFDAVLSRDGLDLALRLSWDWDAVTKSARGAVKGKVDLTRLCCRAASARFTVPAKKKSLNVADCLVNLTGLSLKARVSGREGLFWFTELANPRTEARLEIQLEYEAFTPDARVDVTLRREQIARTLRNELQLLGRRFDRRGVRTLSRFVLEKKLAEVKIDGKALDLSDQQRWTYQLAVSKLDQFLRDELLEEVPRAKDDAPVAFSWSSARLEKIARGKSRFEETRSWRIHVVEAIVVPVRQLELSGRSDSFLDLTK